MSPVHVTIIICNNYQLRNTRIVPVMFGGTRQVIVAKQDFMLIFKIQDLSGRIAERILPLKKEQWLFLKPRTTEKH